MRHALVLASVVCLGSALAAQAPNSCGTGSTYFASTVVNYSPGPGVTAGTGFGITSRILCAPGGAVDVLTLGVQGSVTVGFDVPIVNGPGADFIVWENGFEFGGLVFGELAWVEVSTDGVQFARFPGRYFGPQTALGPFDGLPGGSVKGIAGLGLLLSPPTFAGFANPCTGGGDAFDLADLANHPLVVAGAVNLMNINFVRLVDILGDGTTLDSVGTPIHDPTSATSSSDWDAVCVVNHAQNQNPAKPDVQVSFNEATRQLTLSITEPAGIGILDFGSLLTTINSTPFSLATVISLFPSGTLTPTQVSITSIPLPAGVYASICLSIQTAGGLVGADCGNVTP